MMKVPFVSFRPMEKELYEELRGAFERVLDRSWYIDGEEDAAFEKAFAEYVGTDYCVGVGNGLDALMLALKARSGRRGHRSVQYLYCDSSGRNLCRREAGTG